MGVALALVSGAPLAVGAVLSCNLSTVMLAMSLIILMSPARKGVWHKEVWSILVAGHILPITLAMS